MSTHPLPGTTRRQPSRSLAAAHQRGISIMVSLVLLVVVTLIALGSMRGVVLQARMSGAPRPQPGLPGRRSRAARSRGRAATATAANIPAAGCNAGYCATPALNATPALEGRRLHGLAHRRGRGTGRSATPEAIVEDMGTAPNWYGCNNSRFRASPNCSTRRYRISARSTADGRANVVLQSQFAAP
jgi:type IV pilus assembly protein PilX